MLYTCIQDTLSSRAALGLPAAAFRPSASREQRYLAYKLYTRYPIVARRTWPAFRPSPLREQSYLAFNRT